MLENILSSVHPMDFSKHSVDPTKSASQYCDYPRHSKMHPDNAKRKKQNRNLDKTVRDGLGWRREIRKGVMRGLYSITRMG